MRTSPAGQGAGLTTVRHGMVWFAAGASVILITYLLLAWGPSPLARFGPLIPMCAGAYGLVLGLEKMISGLRRSFAAEDGSIRGPARRAALFCALIVLAAAASGAGAWSLRAPYWSAIKSVYRGERAAEQLKAIAERHAAAIQSGARQMAALQSWKESAAAALQLRPDFAAALDGARYLETPAGGKLRAQAEIDVKFYRLCLEWMDLFRSVQRSFDESSMMEPPDEWGEKQDDIIDRIQALPKHPQEGL